MVRTRALLGSDIYLMTPVRKYVLLRLDELLAKQPELVMSTR